VPKRLFRPPKWSAQHGFDHAAAVRRRRPSEIAVNRPLFSSLLVFRANRMIHTGASLHGKEHVNWLHHLFDSKH
jgi:hypothetical protein